MKFILVQFENDYPTERLKKYYQNTDAFHELMLRQIDNLYEDYEIHVITNQRRKSTNRVRYHYFENLEKNLYAKLQVFGLLDEPAMYLDNDILLVRKFENKHLVGDPFNLYQIYDLIPLLPEHMQSYTHYNTGVMWISKPSKDITESLIGIKDYFLCHDDDWVNDEYPVSYMIGSFGFKMQLMDEVNAYRNRISDLTQYQSVHYTGLGCKDTLLREYHDFRNHT